MPVQATIGLEVHVQLSTRSKIFCGCSTDYSGADANTHVCPVCLGLPGVLPVLNRAVLEKAVQVVAAFGGELRPRSRFDRKNYFYPDMPKAYQISQYDEPVGEGGAVELVDEDGETRRVPLTRIHMEEDAGKLVHQEDGSGTLVDYNRAGVPLLEIVSEPAIRSPEQARRYLLELKAVLEYLEASDCNMEEGSLRCDANVSVAPAGAPLGTRVEIKNMNSFKNVAKAIEYEIERQTVVLEEGGELVQETRLWDDAAGRTRTMRIKEESEDYRYFPEPDLPPVELPAARVAELVAALPELPAAKRARLVAEHGLSEYDAGVVTSNRARARVYEEAVAAARQASPKTLCNWITTELLGRLEGAPVDASRVTPHGLARLCDLVEAGDLNGKQAKTVFARMFETGEDPDAIREELGLENLTDADAVRGLCARVVAEHPGPVEDYRGGKEKALGFLVGQVMKLSRGAASPQVVNQVLKELLST